MRIAIPISLLEYIRLRDDKVIVIKEIPKELKSEFEKFKKEFESAYGKF